MREILPEIERWQRQGKQIAVATVVKVWGSAPRPLGAKMVITDAGDMAGSVSGGCVEGAVFDEAQQVLAEGRPKLVHFGVTNEEAWAVGLSCGGQIEVFIERLDVVGEGDGHELFSRLQQHLAAESLVAVATVVSGPLAGQQILISASGEIFGGLGSPTLDRAVLERTEVLWRSFASERTVFADKDGFTDEDGFAKEDGRAQHDVFIEVLPPRPRLMIVGAVHVAVPLIQFAKTLGFRTIVIDPRTAFLTPERFSDADELITEWPGEALERLDLNENSYVALLSHDLKLDLPALEVSLRHPVRYVGALGSKKTHAKRVAALRETGFSDDEIGKIYNPIGLPLGGRRAEEMAVSILAEIVAVRHDRRAAFDEPF